MPTATINGFRLVYDVTGSGPPCCSFHGGFGGTIADAEHGVMYCPGAVDTLRDWLDRQTRLSTTGNTTNTANLSRSNQHDVEGRS
jgi:hypothetical protein